MEYTFKKIKIHGGKLILDYQKKDKSGHISSHTSKFQEEPEPSFWEVLSRLKIDVCEILELDPGQYAERIVPTGVAYSHSECGTDAVIMCNYKMPGSGATTAINTPLFRIPDDNGSSSSRAFSLVAASNLKDLQDEALRYLLGHRGQGNLFDEDEEADGEREPRNVTPEDSPVRLVAMGQSGTNIRQIAG